MKALLYGLGIASELVLVGGATYEIGNAIIDAFSTNAPDETTAGSAPNQAALLQEIATAQRRILLHWGMSQDAYRQLVGTP